MPATLVALQFDAQPVSSEPWSALDSIFLQWIVPGTFADIAMTCAVWIQLHGAKPRVRESLRTA